MTDDIDPWDDGPSTESGQTYLYGSLADGIERWGPGYTGRKVVAAIEDEARVAEAKRIHDWYKPKWERLRVWANATGNGEVVANILANNLATPTEHPGLAVRKARSIEHAISELPEWSPHPDVKHLVDGSSLISRADVLRLLSVDNIWNVGAEGERWCQRCGGRNPRWHAPSPLWNEVMRDADGIDRYEIVCPQCFADLAVDAGIDPSSWHFSAEPMPVLPQVGRDGRIWDDGQCLWIEPPAHAYEIHKS